MPPFSSLDNPFSKKGRSSDDSAFFDTVLGKKGTIRKRKSSPIGDFSTEDKLIVSPEEQKIMEKEKVITDLMERERLTLRKFFGKEIHVPPLPPEITAEKIKAWEALNLHLHYLPPEEMAEIKRDDNGTIIDVQPKIFPGWKKKPGAGDSLIDLFDYIKDGRLLPKAAQLPGAWVLIDSRQKPALNKRDNQMYANDFLGSVLEELNKKGIIKQSSRNVPLAANSRFGISAHELNQTQVKKAFAQAIGIPEEYISLPKAIEFNVLGNIYYPEWGETNTIEWLEDRFKEPVLKNNKSLRGGFAVSGGLSYIDSSDSDNRNCGTGFRVIARFPSNQKETR
ncbi:MAG TPA: hypothetical protein VFQ60_04250 [Patescibacteria group bacterium]|nr:hypothetical protein [Patescibacteria group bacterium]